MSNHAAIAAVTTAFAQLIRTHVTDGLAGTTVSALRPDEAHKAAAGPLVNLYLFRVGLDPNQRNTRIRRRGTDGASGTEQRLVAFELNYLVTFAGDESALEPQRLLGLTLEAIESMPIITTAMLEEAGNAAMLNGGLRLSEVDEPIRIVPLNLSMEEMSKLWSTLVQTPFRLCLAFQLGTVVLDFSTDLSRPVAEQGRQISVVPTAVISDSSGSVGGSA